MAWKPRNHRSSWLLLGGLSSVFCLLGAELTVKRDETALRAACREQGERIAVLPAGKQVRLRFALSASTSPCYAVSAEVDGRRVKGFVSRDALVGLDNFERSRRQASVESADTGNVTEEESTREQPKISGFSPRDLTGIKGVSVAPHIAQALRTARSSSRVANSTRRTVRWQHWVRIPETHRSRSIVRRHCLDLLESTRRTGWSKTLCEPIPITRDCWLSPVWRRTFEMIFGMRAHTY